MPITWTPENHHKILLYLLKRTETKNIDVDHLATLFEGATPEAIRQKILKLRREAKVIEDGPENPIIPGTNSENPAPTSIDSSSPVKASPAGKSRGRPKKSAKNVAENGGPVANGKGGKTGGKGAGGKRKRGVSDAVVEEEGYGGDVEEEVGNGVKEEGEGEVGVKKIKTEVVNGEGEGVGEGGFMMQEEEGEGEEGEDEGGEMVEA